MFFFKAWVLLYSEFTLLSNCGRRNSITLRQFYCILNLHYSQTQCRTYPRTHMFYCILNLHYSQTNHKGIYRSAGFYCILNLHYSQTWYASHGMFLSVLLYSEFTLLSNCRIIPTLDYTSFTVFWIYTTLKPEGTAVGLGLCFTVFWIYTTLKQILRQAPRPACFTVFWIYTTLKLLTLV